MKLIEKLAQEWWEQQRDLSITGDPESYSPDPESFQAGFRKAREMALDALDESGTDPTGRGWEAIRQLGEEEA